MAQYTILCGISGEPCCIEAESPRDAAMEFAKDYRTCNGDDEPAQEDTVFGDCVVCSDGEVFELIADGNGGVKEIR